MENHQTEKTGTIKKAVFIAAAVLCIIVITAGVWFFTLSTRADNLIVEIENEDIDFTVFEEAYNQLTPAGQALFSEKIRDAFVARVKQTPYTSSDNLVPVDEKSMANYYTFRDIANLIGVTKETYPEVIAYIDAVMKLEKYLPYNDLYFCVKFTYGSYYDAMRVLMTSLNNIDKTCDIIADAYMRAKEYNNNEITKAYMDACFDFYLVIYDWSFYGLKESGAHKTDIDLLLDSFDIMDSYFTKLDKIRDEVSGIVADFPEIS